MQEYCDACNKLIYDHSDKHEIRAYGKTYVLCGLCYNKYTEAANKDDFIKNIILVNLGKKDERLKKQQEDKERLESMILTTSFAIEGHPIKEYKGIVGAQVMAGINMFKDMFAGFRNVIGGRSKALQDSMRKMREQALEELKEEAFRRGANAVIAIKLTL